MANRVRLHKYPNDKYALEINSLIAKDDFTNTEFSGVMTEVNTYLTSSDGINRLSGTFNDLGISNIQYINTADSTSFDGSSAYKIVFINHTA